MDEIKSKPGFGDFGCENFGEGTKWERFKGAVVCVSYNGHSYLGVLKEIDRKQNAVYLSPCSMDSGDELEQISGPTMLPYEGSVPTGLEGSLEENIRRYNKNHTKMKNEK